MSEVRCNSCRDWFDSHMAGCPGCGTLRPCYNKTLYTAKVNSHLYGMAEKADKEARYERRFKSRS